MRRILLLLALVPLLAPVALASEAASCALAPVPARAADASAFGAGPPVLVDAHVTGAAVSVAHARVNETRLAALGATTAEFRFRFEHPDGWRATTDASYALLGTRAVTCFTWPVNAPWVLTELHGWANATASADVLLELWAGD